MFYARSFRYTLACSVFLAGSAYAMTAMAADNSSGDHMVAKSESSKTCTNASPSKMKFSDMVVGFSQSENEQNPFRAAETNSVKAAAKKAGVKRLLYANANDDQAKQVSDIQSMISQGAQAIIVAPLNSTGLKPAFKEAQAKNIPVVTIDRQTDGTFCKDFITFMGSGFYGQGVRAAKALAKATDGKAQIAELQGAYGNSVETDRTDGFAKEIKKHSGMKIVATQTANWSTTEAQKVMAQILLSHPDVNAIYTQSDTMGLGAITAIKQYGKKPGKDIKIVSIDGTKDVVQKIADGTVAADIETNPRFGTRAFEAIRDYMDGKPVHQKIIMKDTLFTPDNAKKLLSTGAVY